MEDPRIKQYQRELTRYREAIDKIYNEGGVCQAAVLKHFGSSHAVPDPPKPEPELATIPAVIPERNPHPAFGPEEPEIPVRLLPPEAMLPRKLKIHEVPKGWGRELWLVNNDKFCGKILDMKPGTRFSLHYHRIKDEVFYVAAGEVTLTHIDQQTGLFIVNPPFRHGDVIEIPRGTIHRLAASPEGARVFEISTTHRESDSYRVYPGDSQKKEQEAMENDESDD